MSASVTRAELVTTLEEILELQKRLVAAARSSKVPVTDLVAQVSTVERLDDRRDDLLEELRRQASRDLRQARPGVPVRDVVLQALTELRWPQNAAFLQEYLWAAHQLQVESRAFAPLRRDERRAFDRAPDSNRAFVAPSLSEDGNANPRWITSSAWELERRIVTARTAELLDLQKILTLAGRPEAGEDTARPWRATDPLLERYAAQVLKIDPPPGSGPELALAWRQQVKAEARKRAGQIRKDDDAAREQAAARLAQLPKRDRVWGRDAAAA